MYLWENDVKMPEFSRLKGDTETEALIIGGGIAGIMCAYMLKNRGVKHLLVEGNRICSGTTRGTTAVITAQHGRIYTKLVKRFGKERAKTYLQANMEAVRKFEEMAEGIDCDFEKKPSYVYSRSDSRCLMVEAAVACELGADAHFTEDDGLPFETYGAVCFNDMAQFHPLKFLAGISRGLNIRENTFVEAVKGDTAYTESGKIKAEKIIFAAHYPFINTRGLYPLKLYQKRSFAIALENAPKLAGTYAEDSDRGIYLRNYKDILIVGGGDCRTGASDDGFRIVRRFAAEHFPEAQEKCAWAVQDCMSLDDVPYVGKYCLTEDNWYVITGFNEWGMTSAMNAAVVIADMVTGQENEFASAFETNRPMTSMQLLSNIGVTLKNFCVPGGRRCTHLGCRLNENTEENSWDCQCHGSRFDHKGHVTDNPAMKNIHQ
ncbi:MAG: FAD-dependent oxidoreductase [Bacillota bacterium]|nr:FAD-dependent oxidoreductase [Bacillota bacterium]